MKNRRGWIRIVEAFVAVLLITGVLLVIINEGYIGKKDISSKVYEIESSILREIQLNSSLRDEILEASGLPVNWDDSDFPEGVKDKINERTPEYLSCQAKICELESTCILDGNYEEDIYAESALITANLETFSPRQLKLFCFVD